MPLAIPLALFGTAAVLASIRYLTRAKIRRTVEKTLDLGL